MIRGINSPGRAGGARRASAVGAALAALLWIAPAAAQFTIFQITTSTLPEAVPGSAYEARIETVLGPPPPYTWRYFVGDFGTICDDPAGYGLTLDSPTTTDYTVLHGQVPEDARVGPATFCIGAQTAIEATPIQTITMNVRNLFRPLPPVLIEVVDVDGHDVTVRWSAPLSGPAPTSYVIEGGADPDQMLAGLTVPADAPVVRVSLPDGTWFLRVSSNTAGGRSARSAPILVALNTTAFPSAPTALTGLVSGHRVSLAWKPTLDAGALEGAVIDVTGTLSGLLPVPDTDGWHLNNVPAGTYTVAVRGRTAAGTGAASAPIVLSVPAPCAGVPQPPERLLVYDGGRTLGAIWDPPSSGTAVESYLVTVAGSIVASVEVGLRRVHRVPIAPGTYTLNVTAVNACGASAPTPDATLVIP